MLSFGGCHHYTSHRFGKYVPSRVEGIEEEEEMSQEDIDYAIESRKASKILEGMEDTGEVDLSTLEEPTKDIPEMPEETIEDKPMGLMSRRNV